MSLAQAPPPCVRPTNRQLILLCIATVLALPASAQLSQDGAVLVQQGWEGYPGTNSEDDRFGGSLSVGDFDGNGLDDVAFGAPGETVSDFVGTGQVTIVYQTLSGLDPSTAQPIAVEDLGIGNAILDEQLGYATTVGNFDGDDYDDLAVGIPWRSYLPMGGPAAWNTGMVLVVYGSGGGLDLGRFQILIPGQDGLVGNPESDDRFGRELAAGDFNDDGLDDLAIAIPLKDIGVHDDTGALSVVYGSAITGLLATGGPVESQLWSQGGIGLDPDGTAEQFSGSLAVGDWDDDGTDDLAVGTPFDEVLGAPRAGSVTILGGSPTGLTPTDAVRLTEAGDAPGTFGPNDYFGNSLANGDFDCDGNDDLAIGTPGNAFPNAPDPDIANAGAVTIHFGSPSGITPAEGIILYRNSAEGAATAHDLFGSDLAAGDFNGDSCSDLVVGVPGGDPSGIEGAGTAFVFAGGPLLPPIFSFTANQAGSAPGTPETADHLGTRLVVGDLDGDGVDDLGLGVPLDSAGGQEDAGQVNLFMGSSSLFRDGFESGDTDNWM